MVFIDGFRYVLVRLLTFYIAGLFNQSISSAWMAEYVQGILVKA